jgi:glutathione peroxidase
MKQAVWVARNTFFMATLLLGASCKKDDVPSGAAASTGAAASGAMASTPSPASSGAAANAATASVYDLTVRTLSGKEQPLSIYRGKVALIVNTASECGFTPQYSGLEALSESLVGKDFVLLGFPSNDFGAQEPGTDEEIAKFTAHDYSIKFPLFSKSKVKGDDANAVFKILGREKGQPKWNFHKYLVDKKGLVVAAYPSAVKPDDPSLKAEIDQLLARP